MRRRRSRGGEDDDDYLITEGEMPSKTDTRC